VTFETPTDDEVIITRMVDAPRPLVWEMWTKPEHITKWMLGPDGWSMTVCENDLRPGGTWKYTWRRTEGTEMTITGTNKEIDPPSQLVSTESWGPDWPETINTLRLTDMGGKTKIEQIIKYQSKEIRDSALKTGMKDGVIATYNRLETYLGSMA